MKKFIILAAAILLSLPLVRAYFFLPFKLSVPQNLSVNAGSTVSFKVQATNLLNSTLANLTLEVSGISGATIFPKSFELQPKETKDIEVNLTIPSYLEGNYKLYVKLSSPRFYDIKTVDLEVKKEEVPKVSVEYLIEPESVLADKKFSFGIGIKNEESETVSVSLNLSVPETWNYTPSQVTQEIKPGETKVSYFSVYPSLEEGEIIAKVSFKVKGKTYQLEAKSSKITPYQEEIIAPIPTGLFGLITSSPQLLATIILAIVAIIVVAIRFWTKPKKGKK
ncbi:MAG: hypothetical protein QXQ69_01005 [Candidatus Aenigmatarchaeota archaeon]